MLPRPLRCFTFRALVFFCVILWMKDSWIIWNAVTKKVGTYARDRHIIETVYKGVSLCQWITQRFFKIVSPGDPKVKLNILQNADLSPIMTNEQKMITWKRKVVQWHTYFTKDSNFNKFDLWWRGNFCGLSILVTSSIEQVHVIEGI